VSVDVGPGRGSLQLDPLVDVLIDDVSGVLVDET
jgi:hypothetical protein